MVYNCHYCQITLAIVLLVVIIVISKPSLFIYIPKYFKYRFYSRRKMIKCYIETTKPLIRYYNDIVDLVAETRRKADDDLYKMYDRMILKGIPEHLARQSVNRMNKWNIELYDDLIYNNLIPMRNRVIKKHNSVTAFMKEKVEILDKAFGINNGYNPFKML